MTNPKHEDVGLYEMTKKLLNKDELDNIFKNDYKKMTELPKTRKIKNPGKSIKIATKDSLFSDKFGKTELIENALMEKGRGIELKQLVRGEAIIQVAAASILASGFFSVP